MSRKNAHPYVRTIWLPGLVGGLLCVLVSLLAWNLKQEQLNAQHEKMFEYAWIFSSNIQTDLDSRILALQRMVDRWVVRGGTPEDEFIQDVQSYLNDFAGLQAVEWVDPTYRVRWVVPLAGNEEAVGLDLGLEPNRRHTLEKAKAARQPMMSTPIDLVQGGKGMLIYFPLFHGNEFDGFILAVFKLHDWVAGVLRFNEENEHLQDVRFTVEMDATPIFTQGGWDEYEPSSFDAEVQQGIMGHQFVVSSRPADAFFINTSSILPYVTGGFGFALSLLVAITIFLVQRTSVEVWMANAAKVDLEKEVLERKETEEKLRQTAARLGLATKAGEIGVWEWDITSGELQWNPLMYELFHVPADVVPTYDTWRNAVHDDDIDNVESLLQKAVQGQVAFDTEFRINVNDGKTKYIQAAATVERDAGGEALRVIGVNWDITQRKHAEKALAAERKRLAAIIQGTNVGTWEWNIQTGETAFNERWAGIIGYTLAEISPTTIDIWMSYVHPDDSKESAELLEKHFNGELEYYEHEARMKHRNGEWVWVLNRGKVSAWTDDGKPLLMSGTLKDITAQKQAEEQIRHLATHDTLTDLPTLRLARDRISMAMAVAARKQQMAAVLFVDLDGFKQVNDTLGHGAGDAVLKETASRLLGCVRHMDTVARIGGDEFLVVLSEVGSKEDAGGVAAKIVATLGVPHEYKGEMVEVGASVGISLCEKECSHIDIEGFIKSADEAMYSIKKSGKNGFAFASEAAEE